MKTDDLIDRLAAEAGPVRAGEQLRHTGLALAAGVAATALIFAVVFGPRSDLWSALAQPVVLAKTLLPLGLGLLALPLALTAARPAAQPGFAARAVWVVPALAALLFLWAMVVPPDKGRQMAFVGKSLSYCLPAIVVLSLPMTAALLAALRRWAPVRPQVCGALAGLAAGGIAAAVYSFFCTEDTPLFYAVWYSVGILLAAGIGAIAGGRLLRW
jgi:hypothetical protein